MNASFGKTTLALVSALTMSLVLLSGIVVAAAVSGLKRVLL